jgi:serine/threonine protein kinase
VSGDHRRLVEIPGIEVVAKLGSGGMGDVLLARKRSSHGFEKLLAVKTIRSDRIQDEQGRAMFLDEARLVARIDHPAVMQVHDFGEADGIFYLTMEYISGMTFRELIDDGAIRLDPLVCARLVAEACWGLHAAHELTDLSGRPLGVVHRDVTPENLILTYSGRVKIVDFGIALMRERTAPVTQVGFVRGKPSYMAPEQRNGTAIDRRTDIYALALVMYELLTKKPLFRTAQVLDSGIAELARNVPAPSIEMTGVPKALDEIVLRGLAEDPKDRFGSAREMALALEALLSAAGSETLQAFADRELARHRAEHDARMAAMLEGRVHGTPQPVPRNAPTLPSDDDFAEAESGTVVDPTITRVLTPEPKRRSPRGLIVAVAAVVLPAALAAAMFLMERPSERAMQSEAVPVDAGVAPRKERAAPDPPIDIDPPPRRRPAGKSGRAQSKPKVAEPPPAKRPRLENGIITRW